MIEQIVDIDRMDHALALFGSIDENIRILEAEYGVEIVCRGTQIKISGEPEQVSAAYRAVQGLLSILNRGETLTEQSVRYVIDMVAEGKEEKIASLAEDCICITAKGKPIKAKTLGQKSYVDAMRQNTITFGIGPAGTGKTYLAVAMAVRAFTFA